MKMIINKNGWSEVSIKNIIINSLSGTSYLNREEWLEFNKRFPKIGKRRQICNCCKKKWEDVKGDVYIAFTNKGNKIICEECKNKFIKEF